MNVRVRMRKCLRDVGVHVRFLLEAVFECSMRGSLLYVCKSCVRERLRRLVNGSSSARKEWCSENGEIE